MNYFYRSITVPKAGGFYAYKTQFIKQIPIKITSDANYDNIINTVKQILNSDNKNIKELYEKLNNYVYKVYNLNEEDILKIENSLKNN